MSDSAFISYFFSSNERSYYGGCFSRSLGSVAQNKMHHKHPLEMSLVWFYQSADST